MDHVLGVEGGREGEILVECGEAAQGRLGPDHRERRRGHQGLPAGAAEPRRGLLVRDDPAGVGVGEAAVDRLGDIALVHQVATRHPRGADHQPISFRSRLGRGP